MRQQPAQHAARSQRGQQPADGLPVWSQQLSPPPAEVPWAEPWVPAKWCEVAFPHLAQGLESEKVVEFVPGRLPIGRQ